MHAADGLRDAFRGELGERFRPDGWQPVDLTGSSAFHLAAFVRPVDGEFAATAEIGGGVRIPDGLPITVTHVAVGVAYEPLRALWPLLGETFRVALVSRDVHEPDWDDDDPAWDHYEGWKAELRTARDASELADELAATISEQAVAFAACYPRVDALLEALDFEEGAEPVFDERVPALLAAAGRFDEARAALERFQPERGIADLTREAKRFARQLSRWIESGGDMTLVPDQPPPPRFARTQSPSFSELWRSAQARSDAVKAIRRAHEGESRDELRTLLEAELERRGLRESPLWIERTLDELTATPAQRTERTVEGLKTLGRLGLGAINAIRKRELPDLEVPTWLEPPDRAGYNLPQRTGDHWTAVRVSPGATGFLTNVHDALPTLAGLTVPFRAWLEPEDANGGETTITVNIGTQPIGDLDTPATAAFLPSIATAAQTDELVCTMARLTTRPQPPHYLLEIQLPD